MDLRHSESEGFFGNWNNNSRPNAHGQEHRRRTGSSSSTQEAIDAAWEEAVVDAYDDEERIAGIANAVENELQFPFPAKVMGIQGAEVLAAYVTSG